MTEGCQDGSVSTPEAFTTQTVTSSSPTTTFQMAVPGHYVFHSNTNPGNQNNWGTIIVEGSVIGIEEASAFLKSLNDFGCKSMKQYAIS